MIIMAMMIMMMMTATTMPWRGNCNVGSDQAPRGRRDFGHSTDRGDVGRKRVAGASRAGDRTIHLPGLAPPITPPVSGQAHRQEVGAWLRTFVTIITISQCHNLQSSKKQDGLLELILPALIPLDASRARLSPY